MKYCFVAILFAFAGCSYLVSQSSSTSVNSDEIKARIMKIDREQRNKAEWMKADACPADVMPNKGRRQADRATECAANPEKCLEECNDYDGDGCFTLAQLIQKHDKIENEVADVLYHRACSLGIVAGCTNRAANLFERKEAEPINCAVRTFEKACSQDDPWACTMYGLALSGGIGHVKDVEGAKRMLDKACEVSIDKAGEACKKAKDLKAVIIRSEG